jgi:hypothetical protein
MKNMIKFTPKNTDKGFTLFVAVLVASLVLAIGFSIGNIVLKQLAIAGSGGGSLVAFYAADSAIECATYWDRKKADGTIWDDAGPFATSTPLDFDPNTMYCGNQTAARGWYKFCDNNPTTCDSASVAATTTFSIDFKNPADPKYLACAYVAISKWTDPLTGDQKTSIISRGYNTDLVENDGDFYCNLDRQRVVERGLFQSY